MPRHRLLQSATGIRRSETRGVAQQNSPGFRVQLDHLRDEATGNQNSLKLETQRLKEKMPIKHSDSGMSHCQTVIFVDVPYGAMVLYFAK